MKLMTSQTLFVIYYMFVGNRAFFSKEYCYCIFLHCILDVYFITGRSTFVLHVWTTLLKEISKMVIL